MPVRAQVESFTTFDIGALGSAYYLGFGAGCLFGSHLVYRSGHIRTFTAMVALTSTTALAHALLISPIVWWFLRGLTGFCFAVLYIVIESWLNEKSTNKTRGFVFSVYTIINLTVITLGQMMLIIDTPIAFTLFSLASILVSLAAIPVAFTTAQAPKPIVAVKIRVPTIFKISPVGVIGCFSVGLTTGSFWALGPIFAQRGESGTLGVAIFMSAVVIAGAVGQWPLGRLSDRMDRRKIVLAACLGAAMAGIAISALVQVWVQAFFIGGIVFGLFAFPLYSICVAHTNDRVSPEGYVEAAGGLLLVFAAGAVAGPLVASAVVKIFGMDMLFAYTAFVHVAMAGYTIRRMRVEAPTPQDEHIDFADALRVAQTVSNIDPLSSANGRSIKEPPSSIKES